MLWLSRFSNYLGTSLGNIASIVSLSNIAHVCHVAPMFINTMLSKWHHAPLCSNTLHHNCFWASLVTRIIICGSVLGMQSAQLFELLRVLHDASLILPLAATDMLELFTYQICVSSVSVFGDSLAQDQIIKIAFYADREHGDVIACC